MKAGASAEWEPLRHVMVHEPGTEVFFGLLAPSAHLYERFFDLGAAKREHQSLCQELRSYGVKVTYLEKIIPEAAENDSRLFGELAELARARSGQRCEGEGCGLSRRLQREYLSPLPFEMRDPAHLLMIAVLNPMVVLTAGGVRTELRRPFHNLYFMRDQQICTDRGIVQCRMAAPEREGESEVTGLGLRAAGAVPIAAVRGGRLEGGDFIPLGDFALLGVGPRTDPEGAASLMKKGIGFEELAVVHEPLHPLISGHDPMVCMHLDTYCNIPAEGVAVGNPLLLERASVEVWQKSDGGYKKVREGLSLSSYLREKGYEIIEISTLDQLCYATNFLTLRDGECLAPEAEAIAPEVIRRLREKPDRYAALLAQAEHDYNKGDLFPAIPAFREHGISMQTIRITNATGGYGGAHCMTCVLRRG